MKKKEEKKETHGHSNTFSFCRILFLFSALYFQMVVIMVYLTLMVDVVFFSGFLNCYLIIAFIFFYSGCIVMEWYSL